MSQKPNRRQVLEAIGAGGLLSLSGCSGDSGNGDDDPGSEGTPTSGTTRTTTDGSDSSSTLITLGELNPLSCGAAVYGTPEHWGIVLGAEDLGKFEVDGQSYQFEVNSNDDECSNENGINIMRRLLQQSELKFIFGSLCSNVSSATSDIIRDSNATQFINGSSTQRITFDNDQIFRNSFTQLMFEPGVVEIVNNQGYENVTLLGDDQHPATEDMFGRLEPKLLEGGANDVQQVLYSRGQSDFASRIQRMDSFGADAVYLNGYTEDLYSFISQAREYQLDAQIISGNAPSREQLESLIDNPEALSNLTVLTNSGTLVLDSAGYEPASTYRQKVEERFDDVQNWHVGLAHYDAVFALSKAMQNAGSVEDYDAIRSELLSLTIDEALGDTPLGGPGQKYISPGEDRLYDDWGQAWVPTYLMRYDGYELTYEREVSLSDVPVYPESWMN